MERKLPALTSVEIAQRLSQNLQQPPSKTEGEGVGDARMIASELRDMPGPVTSVSGGTLQRLSAELDRSFNADGRRPSVEFDGDMIESIRQELQRNLQR